MTLAGRRLKELRVEKGKTLQQMARETGLTSSAISNYENGFRMPRSETLDSLGKYFDVDTDYIIGKKDTRKAKDPVAIFNAGYEKAMRSLDNLISVPIYRKSSLAKGNLDNETPIDHIVLSPSLMFSEKAFGHTFQGDSMEPTIHEGELVIFQKTSEISPNQIGAFSLNGKYYCGRFKRLADHNRWLFSDNPKYDPIPIGIADDFKILGVYKRKISTADN